MKKTNTNRQVNNGLEKNSKIGRLTLVCLFWLAVWQVGSLAVGNSLLFPTVFETLGALKGLVQDTSFYLDVAWTLFRCLLAVLLSFALGFVLAGLAYKSGLVRSFMTLPVSFFKAVPVMAIVIYLILLIKSDWVAVAACFLMCFPIVYTNILEGLDSVQKEFFEVAKIYEFKKRDIEKYIFWPSLTPNLNAAMKIVAGLSWKAVVAAEVLSVPDFSLGQGMISAKYYLETPKLFAYILVIVALSLILEKAIMALTNRLLPKAYEGSKIRAVSMAEKPPKAPMIKLSNINKSFGDKEVLHGITCEIEAGDRVAISGPSGSGKTTLARIIAGLDNADGGKIEVDTKLDVSFLFQEDRLLPWLNVYDNLAVGAFRKNASLNDDAILSMAKALELEDVLWNIPEALSGGMKHRVALGRTLLADCKLLILDEPFRGLDEELKSRIVDRLWDESTTDKTVIVISHSQEDLELLGIDKSISVE